MPESVGQNAQPAQVPSLFHPLHPSPPLPTSQLVANYLDPIIEALAYQDCLAVSNISSAGQFYVTQLQNGTLYNVKVITSNIFYDSQLYEAGLKTVDLTPPVFVDIVQ